MPLFELAHFHEWNLIHCSVACTLKKKVISGLVFSSLRTQEINSSICGLRMINIHENFKNSISLPTFVENMTGYGFLTMYIYLKYGTCCCLLPWINDVVVASVEFFLHPICTYNSLTTQKNLMHWKLVNDV